VAKGDIDGVAEVSRRFFYTTAGGEATLLLGKHFWDHGSALAAALCLGRLQDTSGSERFEPMLSLLLAASWRQVGETTRAIEILTALKEHSPRGELTIGSRSVPMFGDESQALAWLDKQTGAMPRAARPGTDEWTMYRGDAARNAIAQGTLPLLNPRWRVQCADHPRVADAIAQLERAYHDLNAAALPSAHPLAVDNVVLMRTTTRLMAVEFSTGKRIWEYPPPSASNHADEVLDQLFAESSNRQLQLGLNPQVRTALDERVWSDLPFGALSSDGECVYLVEDLGFAPTINYARRIAFNGQVRMDGIGPKDTNHLAAVELKTEGKVRWEIGGADGKDEPKLAGAFFLGPPLPVLGRLYAIAEMKGQEIRLIALSAETGKVEWSQQLAVVEDGVLNDFYRRSAGAMPSFADGILVCPTSAGAIVAVDLATRSLLWGFQYPRGSEDGDDFGRLQVLRARTFNQGDERVRDGWVDATATIADGKVLVTPVEANTLYCLNLIDGSVLWKQDRGTNLYVGGVFDGSAVLVGRRAVTAVKLTEGQSAWDRPLDLPGGAMPSGRGFISGDNYFIPLSSAEVAQIDLNRGQITARARSRRGEVPGNLISFHGEVISQGTEYLETFYQLDALKTDVAQRLKANPDDPQALMRSGEIHFDAGNIDDAIRQFRRAHELAPDELSSELLVDSLLAGLRRDFAKHRDAVNELEQLLAGKPQRLEFLRLLAEGLKASG
jgi:outer membrane protein assembly factor BamB